MDLGTRWGAKAVVVLAGIALACVVLAARGGDTDQVAAGTPCTDQMSGGGAMRFKGIGQLSHILTRAGDVCPGVSETWSFSTVDLGSNDQYVTIQVLADEGSVDATVTLIDGTEVSLTPGMLFQVNQRYGTLQVTVVGSSTDRTTYRVQACRSLVPSPCRLSDTVTAKPGDVNCDGRVDARDAFAVLEYEAGLASAACMNVAEAYLDGFINSIDAEMLLQYAAGLVDEILPGF